jgi:23S rRNA (guanosine2251-2'-O)-methyltransferase
VEDKELIFGRNPVLEYLRGAEKGDHVELYLSESAHGKIIESIIAEARGKQVKVQYMDRDFFKRLGPSSRHQGVAMKLASPVHEPGEGPETLLHRAAETKGVLVLLDQITDTHNAGSIIRTAEALGCAGVIVPRAHSAAITPAVVKSAAGATAHIDIAQVGNIAAFLDEARERKLWIVGTADQGATDLKELGGVRPCVVIIGSEGAGMRRLTAEKCDYIVRIPLAGRVSSLNASVAAGIILYEITSR